LVNWVWYCTYEAFPKEYSELMIDIDGNKHHFTSTTGGKMRAEIWER